MELFFSDSNSILPTGVCCILAPKDYKWLILGKEADQILTHRSKGDKKHAPVAHWRKIGRNEN